MLAQQRQIRHPTLAKWEADLARQVPETIWASTWISYRGTAENAFMWQLLYRVITTQPWRYPAKPATDPNVWCTRCNTNTREDTIHCQWSCPISVTCWQWGAQLLQIATPNREAVINLGPEHIFIAIPLPENWQIPDRLWQTLKAILCWQIWKNRNAHFMAGKPAEAEKVIRKAWHRLGMYLRKEWRHLTQKAEQGKITTDEAAQMMHSRFGDCPNIWNLHRLHLQIPPVPPRPP